jgi:hypothetical protein
MLERLGTKRIYVVTEHLNTSHRGGGGGAGVTVELVRLTTSFSTAFYHIFFDLGFY